MSCIFHPCIFDRPVFSCLAFSVAPSHHPSPPHSFTPRFQTFLFCTASSPPDKCAAGTAQARIRTAHFVHNCTLGQTQSVTWQPHESAAQSHLDRSRRSAQLTRHTDVYAARTLFRRTHNVSIYVRREGCILNSKRGYAIRCRIIIPVPKRGARYCDEHVCMSVCLSVCSRISRTTQTKFIKLSPVYVATVAVARRRCDTTEIRDAILT